MKRFAVILLGFLWGLAIAQSNPGFVYGQVPSAAQWNSYFSGKTDLYPGGIPISYGGTGATTANQALNNLTGAVASGFYLRGNGTNVVASQIQAGDVPTLNQSTTGTAGGLAGGALGSVPYQSGAGATSFLAGTTSATPSFFSSTGTGAAAQAPALTSSTGSGNVVLSVSPSITTPTLNTATLAAPTISGTLTINGKTLALSNSLTLAGTDSTTMTFPSTSASIARIDTSQTFAGTQTFSGTLAGTATVNIQAAPNPIGSVTPNTGAFTTLAASGAVSGAGFSTYLASPPAIGGSAAAAGSFTTLSASSTVSGTGFSTYLASPPAIGGTAPAAITGTTVKATSTYSLTNLLVSATAPTITSCGGGSPTISAPNGTAAFRVTTGNAISACTLGMPTAATGWNCFATDITTPSNAWMIKQSASSTTSVTLTNYLTTSTQNWNTNDVLVVSCFAY